MISSGVFIYMYLELEVPRQIKIFTNSDRSRHVQELLCMHATPCHGWAWSFTSKITLTKINMIHRIKCRCRMPFECEVGPNLKCCVATTQASSKMKCYPMEVCSTIDSHTPHHIHNQSLNIQEQKGLSKLVMMLHPWVHKIINNFQTLSMGSLIIIEAHVPNEAP